MWNSTVGLWLKCVFVTHYPTNLQTIFTNGKKTTTEVLNPFLSFLKMFIYLFIYLLTYLLTYLLRERKACAHSGGGAERGRERIPRSPARGSIPQRRDHDPRLYQDTSLTWTTTAPQTHFSWSKISGRQFQKWAILSSPPHLVCSRWQLGISTHHP